MHSIYRFLAKNKNSKSMDSYNEGGHFIGEASQVWYNGKDAENLESSVFN